MVNLGVVQDFESCPAQFVRVSFFLPDEAETPGPLLSSWPFNDLQIWQLFFPRRQSMTLDLWAEELAGCLQGLGYGKWCLNTRELIKMMNSAPDQALIKWGELFWPNFRMDSVFIFTAQDALPAVKKTLDLWHRSLTNICVRGHYDFTVMEIPPADEPETGTQKISFWKRLGIRHCC